MANSDFDELIAHIVQFRDERDWAQFHSPRSLCISVSIEAAELLEHFQWSDTPRNESALTEEVADVMIYALLLCHELGINPREAILNKIDSNKEKYPTHLARGRSAKYSDLESE